MAKKKSKQSENEGGFSKMLATTVILGIVFSAGLITGQRLLRAEARAPMVSLSTTKVAPQPGDEEEPKPSLRTTFSFYEHLTGQAEATPPPPVTEASDEESKPAPAEAEEAPAEVKVEVEIKAEAGTAAEPEAQAPADDHEPAPAPADTAAATAAPTEEPKAAAPPTAEPDKPVADLLDEVVASIANSSADAADEAAALPARYTLQVSSHPDRASAEREIGRLDRVGVEPHVVKVNVPGKGELWRVRVGKFHTMDEARDFQGSIKSKRGVAGFVTPL